MPHKSAKQIHKDILSLIAEEITFAHLEGTPTARLTSLALKLTKYFEKL